MPERPLLIGGLSYSGKTPLRLMLNAHPSLNITRRTYMWTRFYGRYGNLDHAANFERCLTALLAVKGVRELRPDVARIRREFRQGPPTYGHLFALFHRHFAERQGKPRWGDQLGSIEQYAGPIFTAYPKAQMIHMIRDPRQRCLSGRRGTVGWEAARWRESARLAAHNQERYPERYLVVQYEALLARPEPTLRMICAFLQEPFQLGVLEAVRVEEMDRPDHTLSPHDRAFIQAYTKAEMRRVQYWPEAEPPRRRQWPGRLVAWAANLVGAAAYSVAGRRTTPRHFTNESRQSGSKRGVIVHG